MIRFEMKRRHPIIVIGCIAAFLICLWSLLHHGAKLDIVGALCWAAIIQLALDPHISFHELEEPTKGEK